MNCCQQDHIVHKKHRCQFETPKPLLPLPMLHRENMSSDNINWTGVHQSSGTRLLASNLDTSLVLVMQGFGELYKGHATPCLQCAPEGPPSGITALLQFNKTQKDCTNKQRKSPLSPRRKIILLSWFHFAAAARDELHCCYFWRV